MQFWQPFNAWPMFFFGFGYYNVIGFFKVVGMYVMNE